MMSEPPGGADICTLAPPYPPCGGARFEGGRVPHLNSDRSPLVRIEVVDHLPDGRLVGRVESPHETVFVINGENLPADAKPYFAELEGVMREGIDSHMWERNLLPPPEEEEAPGEEETPDEGVA